MSKSHNFQAIIRSAKQLLIAIRKNCPLDDAREASSNPWLRAAAKQAIGNPASSLRYWLTRDPGTDLNILDADNRRRRIFTLYKGSLIKLPMLQLDEIFFSIEPRYREHALPRLSSTELKRLESAIQSLEYAVQTEKMPQNDDGDELDNVRLTMDGLRGRSLRFFRFLAGKSHKSYFDDLRHAETIFTKPDITDAGIVRGIKDLINDLDGIEAPYVVEWSKGDTWVRLDAKPETKQGRD